MSDITYNKMDPEVKAKWLEALRSGNYKQIPGGLRHNNGCNCCLGVLADMNNVPFREFEWGENEDFMEFDEDFKIYNFGQEKELFGAVPEGYCGLEQNVIDKLVSMNDDEHKTFPEIADWIEENL